MNNSGERRTKQRSGVGTGTTSLLMIFTVLCFATLAMLSLATSVSNQRMQQRSFTALENRTVAEGSAAEALAELDAALSELQNSQTGGEGYQAAAFAKAKELGWAEGTAENQVALSIPVADETVLITEVRILPAGGALRYALVSQVSEWTGSWAPEQGPGLWPGTVPTDQPE